ncbi:MAG: glycosyltransferase family 2 protein [Candidatus Omnitrophica bacterium]|nr:glycosyltransferase family 2 protein [Candidatus Omnitrophota bacterium]
MDPKKDLLILIPVYNEARFIAEVVKESAPYAAEVVVVDDGSVDDTGEVAGKAGATVIRHLVNKGKGAALQTGFRYALDKGYRAVLTMDGDGQHRPEDISSLLEHYQKSGAGMVVGCRSRNLKNMPLDRFVTNWFTSALISFLARHKIHDSQSGFRVIDVRIVPSLSFSTSHFDTESEILVDASRAGFKITEAPIQTVYGTEKSKQNPRRDTIRFFRFFFRRLFK